MNYKGTPKNLKEAIENATKETQLSLESHIKDYLAQGLATEMLNATTKEEIALINRLIKLWKVRPDTPSK